MNNKLLSALLILCAFTFSCSNSGKEYNTIKVAATPVPQAQMLEYIKPDLAKEGIELKVIIMDDYNLPNRALENGDVDANFFQHEPFLQRQVSQFHYHICPLASVHIEPMGVYSKKITSLSEIPDGAVVAIPNDPSNEARSLLLLQKAGLITVNPEKKDNPSTLDIVSNPKKLKFEELEAPMLTRSLPDVSIAVIPTNFALEAGLIPKKDSLSLESTDSPYVNIIAVRCESLTNPNLLALKNAMTSQRMQDFILANFKGQIEPAFRVNTADPAEDMQPD